MNDTIKSEIDLSMILNLIPYLDYKFNLDQAITLELLITKCPEAVREKNEYKLLVQALEKHPEYKEIKLINQSGSDDTWTDDLIEACTFQYEDNYYITYRGTGDGRWVDNGEGMTAQSTPMQEAAKAYFDEMVQKYHLDDKHLEGSRIVVSGHSKGGNEAQYVYMTSEYEYLIDNCYNYDGQGFSAEAVKYFKEKYGDRYEEKLEEMYSICGKEDYVHDLGYTIIPEENTYFVETSGEGFGSYHAPTNLISDDDNNYVGLTEGWENHVVKQGEIGQFVKKLSEIMMQMEEEDLNGVTIAIMAILNAVFSGNFEDFIPGHINDSVIGSVLADSEDFVDLAAYGIPVALATLILTPEGQKFLINLLAEATEMLNDEFGPIGVIVGYTIGTIALQRIVIPFVGKVVVVAVVLDFLIESYERIKETLNNLEKFVNEFKEQIIVAINTIGKAIYSLTSGYQYANVNPQILLDTYKLNSYGQRLQAVNRRLTNLDFRMDRLYSKVGLLDLWNLMQSDFKISYSYRLNRCANYLIETANDFNNIENEIACRISG